MKPNSHRINCLARQMLVKLGLKPDGSSLYSVQLMSWYLGRDGTSESAPDQAITRLERLQAASMADSYRALTAAWEGDDDGALLADEMLDKQPHEFAFALLQSLATCSFSDPRPRPSRTIAAGRRGSGPKPADGPRPLQ